MKTSQITIRKVDPILKQKLVSRAKLSSQSMNDFILDAIRAKVGVLKTATAQEPSWKKFIGVLPEGAFNQSALDELDKIDESMWENTK